jgi:hypothetical protein
MEGDRKLQWEASLLPAPLKTLRPEGEGYIGVDRLVEANVGGYLDYGMQHYQAGPKGDNSTSVMTTREKGFVDQHFREFLNKKEVSSLYFTSG